MMTGIHAYLYVTETNDTWSRLQQHYFRFMTERRIHVKEKITIFFFKCTFSYLMHYLVENILIIFNLHMFVLWCPFINKFIVMIVKCVVVRYRKVKVLVITKRWVMTGSDLVSCIIHHLLSGHIQRESYPIYGITRPPAIPSTMYVSMRPPFLRLLLRS